MKKAQFTSPIVLILLIVTYFMIASQINSIQSALLASRTNLLKITNDIKGIEELDLEWQANITSRALMLLSTINSSGTINLLLGQLNASISFQNSPLLMNYTKLYTIWESSKAIKGTIIVPYPFNDFAIAEANIRSNCAVITQSCVDNSINNELISAELLGSSILLSHLNYSLTNVYSYIIILE